MWENILVTGLILNFGCNNTLLSEGHNMVSSQENSGSNTLYKNKLHLWIWITTFGRSTKSWSLRPHSCTNKTKNTLKEWSSVNYEECHLEQDSVTWQRLLNNWKVFWRSQKDDRPLYLKNKKHIFFRQIDYFGEQLPPFYLLDAFLAGMIKVVAQPNNFWSSECILSIIWGAQQFRPLRHHILADLR